MVLGRQKRCPQAPRSAGFCFSYMVWVEMLTFLWWGGSGSVPVGSQGLSGDTPPALQQRQSGIPTWAGAGGLQEGQGSWDGAAQQSFAAQWPRVGRTVGLAAAAGGGGLFSPQLPLTPTPAQEGNLVLPAPAERKRGRAVTPSTALGPQRSGCRALPTEQPALPRGAGEPPHSPLVLTGCFRVQCWAGFDPPQGHPRAGLE